MTPRQIVVLILFALAGVAFLGAWIIALGHAALDSANFNAFLAAGGFFGTVAFFTERLQ